MILFWLVRLHAWIASFSSCVCYILSFEFGSACAVYADRERERELALEGCMMICNAGLVEHMIGDLAVKRRAFG